MRASIYNGMPLEGVLALLDFMQDFEQRWHASGGDSEAAALSRIRDGIDAIDDQILKLLSQRLKLVLEAGEVKRALGMTGALHRIEREEAIYARLAEASTDLTEPEIRKIFREIISCQMAREQQQRVAFLGPPGTFSQQAVQEHFGTAPPLWIAVQSTT